MKSFARCPVVWCHSERKGQGDKRRCCSERALILSVTRMDVPAVAEVRLSDASRMRAYQDQPGPSCNGSMFLSENYSWLAFQASRGSNIPSHIYLAVWTSAEEGHRRRPCRGESIQDGQSFRAWIVNRS